MYDNGYGTDPYAYQPQPQPRPSRASSFLRTVLSAVSYTHLTLPTKA